VDCFLTSWHSSILFAKKQTFPEKKLSILNGDKKVIWLKNHFMGCLLTGWHSTTLFAKIDASTNAKNSFLCINKRHFVK
jgi:hypothetical protein